MKGSIRSYNTVLLLFLTVQGLGAESAEEDASIWANGTYDDIFEHLACEENLEDSVPFIYDENSWTDLYQTYYDASQKEIEEGEEEWSDDGFVVEHEIRLNQYGRGVYSKNFIPYGTLVYRCYNTRCIEDPDQIRLLLKNLPRHSACEVMHWAYVATFSTAPSPKFADGDPSYCLELDDGALFNHAYHASDVNLMFDQCFPPQNESDDCDCEYRAIRDIYPGEELLVNYGEFTKDDYSLIGLDFPDWDDFTEEQKKNAETLGYTKSVWDDDKDPPILSSHVWEDLSSKQIDAAIYFGFSKTDFK